MPPSTSAVPIPARTVDLVLRLAAPSSVRACLASRESVARRMTTSAWEVLARTEDRASTVLGATAATVPVDSPEKTASKMSMNAPQTTLAIMDSVSIGLEVLSAIAMTAGSVSPATRTLTNA